MPFALVRVFDARSRRSWWLNAIAFALMLTGAAATDRKTALLVPVAVVLYLAFYRPRQVLRLAPLGLVVLVGLVHFAAPGALGTVFSPDAGLASSSTTHRAGDFTNVAPDVLAHPVLGRGFGTLNPDQPKQFRINDDEYIDEIWEVGVVGLLAYLWMIIAPVFLARRAIRARDPNVALARARRVGGLRRLPRGQRAVRRDGVPAGAVHVLRGGRADHGRGRRARRERATGPRARAAIDRRSAGTTTERGGGGDVSRREPRRVLVHAAGELGERLAGPEIRALEFAKALSAEYEVTLAAQRSTAGERDGIRVVPSSRRRLLREAVRHDAILSACLPPYLLALRPLRGLVAIADLYDPHEHELAALAGGPRARARATRTRRDPGAAAAPRRRRPVRQRAPARGAHPRRGRAAARGAQSCPIPRSSRSESPTRRRRRGVGRCASTSPRSPRATQSCCGGAASGAGSTPRRRSAPSLAWPRRGRTSSS